MMKNNLLLTLIGGLIMISSCQEPATSKDNFKYITEKFADLKIIRYKIPGWEQLSLQQKKLVYYLTEAGYSGRDIIYDQNYKYNLSIKRAFENIVKNYKGDQATEDWGNFMIYIKRIWFSNGIHHHYSMNKFIPDFSRAYFDTLLKETSTELSEEVVEVIFNPEIDAKKVNLDPEKGLLKSSATNFYDLKITEKEVDEFYGERIDKNDDTPISYGLNSQIVKNENGKLEEEVWKLGGKYSEAIEKIIFWLEKAKSVAENQKQGDALGLLIEYYQTGDLQKWDEYNIAWVAATEGDIDYINGFIEVYNDPKGYRGSFENIVQIKDFELSKKMRVILTNIQWFEDNLPFMDIHKKEKVVGIEYNVVNVAGEAGDASPATPIGVNLPNAEWIRQKYGSKSISLGNIIEAYEQASGGELLNEFVETKTERELIKKYGSEAGKMHTALHEVVGHASGQINEGVGTTKETLKSYASTLEEARADLVGLYYIRDPKMIELGLLESLQVGRVEYDGYIRNGLMTQLIRIEEGQDIEESHMRNRQIVAKWVFEKGQKDSVITQYKKNNKTYFKINDYEKLRSLFGQLLREIQRIKSEGDYEAGKTLVENYGVKVNQEIHKEVLKRIKPLKLAPYGGFINPLLEPIIENGEITNIEVKYPDNFTKQMLYYGEKYRFLPDYN